MLQKIFLFLLFPLLFVDVKADEFVIKNFEKKPNDLAARRYEVMDPNDEACALIKIKTDLKGLQFESNLGISKVTKKTGEYWVYISPGERRIKLIKEGFVAKDFYIPSEIQIESYDVFNLIVTTNVKFPITINRSPEDVKVFLDGKLRIDTPDKTTISNVSFGRHSIKLEKSGYSTIEDTIFVEEDQFEFSYSLEELEKVPVYIKSQPVQAQILIDKTNHGFTNNRFYIYPGEHDLMLIKDNYQPIEKNITVKKDGDNEFSYNLKYNMGTVHINTNINNPTILIDGDELKSPSHDTLLSAERHKITVKKDKYYEQTEWVTPMREQTITKVFHLKQKTGDLYTNVYPEEATVELYNYNGEKLLDQWQGTRIRKNLQVGFYTLKIHRKHYAPQEKTIEIKENQEKTVEANLSAYELEPGTKANSIIWSVFVPGAGQWYSKQTGRGWLYFLGGIASVGSSYYCYNKMDNLTGKYESLKTDYRTAENPEIISEKRLESEDVYEDIKKFRQYRDISYIAVGAVYAINLLDAIIFGGRKITESSLSGYMNNDRKVQFGLSNQPQGVGVKVTVRLGN